MNRTHFLQGPTALPDTYTWRGVTLGAKNDKGKHEQNCLLVIILCSEETKRKRPLA